MPPSTVPGITGGVPDGTGGPGAGRGFGALPGAVNPLSRGRGGRGGRGSFTDRFGGAYDSTSDSVPGSVPGITGGVPDGTSAGIPGGGIADPGAVSPMAPSAPPNPFSPPIELPIRGLPQRGTTVVGRSPGRTGQGQRTDDPFELPIFEPGTRGPGQQAPAQSPGRGFAPGLGWGAPPPGMVPGSAASSAVWAAAGARADVCQPRSRLTQTLMRRPHLHRHR